MREETSGKQAKDEQEDEARDLGRDRRGGGYRFHCGRDIHFLQKLR